MQRVPATEEVAVPIHGPTTQPIPRQSRKAEWNVVFEREGGSKPKVRAERTSEHQKKIEPVSKLQQPKKQIPTLQPAKESAPAQQSPPLFLKTIQDRTLSAINQSLAEGKHQLTSTVNDANVQLTQARATLRTLPARMRGSLERFWRAAKMPIVLPSQKPGRRPPTKLKLFVIDTVRFGGTFALIFGVLFAAINYQSFWQIARAQLALGTDIKTEQGLAQIVSGQAPSPSLFSQTNSHGNLVAYLPEVGPYENRLIIPKIGQNVPIVRPSMESLMREDWKKFEEDIQSSLHDGVVHYPGSAKPGQAGNFFLTGHSSYYPWDNGHFKDVFARLSELAAGDTYVVYYGGDKHTYRVTGKKEVSPSNVSVLDQPTDKRTASLMTCTPVGTTLHRLIVSAEEIDRMTGEVLKVGERANEQLNKVPAGLGALPI